MDIGKDAAWPPDAKNMGQFQYSSANKRSTRKGAEGIFFFFFRKFGNFMF
jgi:hypothetical protein